MRTLTFFNHAGGAGKSTTVLNVGHTLASLGYRVAVIDADPQANLTRWVGLAEPEGVEGTLHAAVVGARGEALALPEPRRAHGMDVLPSNLDLAEIEPILPGMFMGHLRLRDALRAWEDRYDFVLIDSPPSLGQLSTLSVLAADALVVPVPAVNKGLEGLVKVTRMVNEFRRAVPQLHIALLVPTRVSATNISQDSLGALRAAGLAPVSTPLTERPSLYPSSQTRGEPVAVFDPRNPAVQEIRAVTREILDAVGEESRARPS